MKDVAGITLAALLTISGWFHDGLKALQAKNYDVAIAKLTKVYKQDVPGNPLREQALFYRAQAYHGKQDKKKALADLLLLLKGPVDEQLRQQAATLYQKWGGDPKKLMPKDSPKAVWAKFSAAAKKGDMDSCLALSAGSWKAIVAQMGARRGGLKREFERKPWRAISQKIGAKDEAGKAWVEVDLKGDGRETVMLGFVLDRKKNCWVIDSFKPGGRRGDRPRPSARTNNLTSLKQIALALIMYADDYDENLPTNLDQLKKVYLGGEGALLLWIHPKTGKKIPFIYCPGLRAFGGNAGQILVAAPMAVDGRREAVFMDGHAELMDEKKFLAQAKKQKWVIKGAFKKEDVPKATQEKIRELVKQLGDKSFKVRRAARKQLEALGPDVHPVLEEYLKDKDPEIRATVNNILEGK